MGFRQIKNYAAITKIFWKFCIWCPIFWKNLFLISKAFIGPKLGNKSERENSYTDERRKALDGDAVPSVWVLSVEKWCWYLESCFISLYSVSMSSYFPWWEFGRVPLDPVCIDLKPLQAAWLAIFGFKWKWSVSTLSLIPMTFNSNFCASENINIFDPCFIVCLLFWPGRCNSKFLVP